MAKARVDFLYHEHRDYNETKSGVTFNPTHRVRVNVREWNAARAPADIVLHAEVFVDGKKTLDSRTVLDISGFSHAAAQREGMRIFDELVAAHPFFGQQD